MYTKYNQKHKDDYWSPHFARKVTDSAVFDIKRFKTTHASLKYIRQIILDSLKQNKFFKDVLYKNKNVEIEILSNGSIGLVYFVDSVREKLDRYYYSTIPSTKFELYIKHILESQTQPWFPALAHPVDILDLTDATKEEEKLKVKANSFVAIVL